MKDKILNAKVVDFIYDDHYYLTIKFDNGVILKAQPVVDGLWIGLEDE